MRPIISFDDLDPVAWVNGAGETTELVSLTDSEELTPDRRRWRLSVARLERAAPFSSLPGLSRTFLPIGAEAVLEIDGHVHRVAPEEPQRFHGSQSVSLVELPRPCFALNLMVEDVVGTSDEAAQQPVVMSLPPSEHPAAQPRFAFTLAASNGFPRFQLLELGESDVLSSHLGVVILH